MKSHQHRAVHKRNGTARRLLRAQPEIIISPAAIHRFITGEPVELRGNHLLDPFHLGRILGLLRPSAQTHQRL